MRIKLFSAAALLAAFPVQAVESQALNAAPTLTYADLADLAVGAPVVAHVRIRGAERLGAELAANVPAGHRRFLVEAEIVALIRASGGMEGRVSYLVDLPNDSRGRPAQLRRRSEWLVIARRVPNRPAELQLAAPDAQLPYAPETAARLRDILRDASAANTPARITGIGRAFHVPGNLPGESETQFFLQTANERPISLTVLRRPGEQPRWAVALSEMVDEAAAPPAPDTLLWYRLACTLPQRLPGDVLHEASADEVRAIQADYRVIIEGLGACARTRARR
ncbi:MAG TPA: hypothetical protein VLK25_00315 [Allosphingosinicella sp.]|nr:hypothetical protein [Allosphingosinicella sp.]